MNIKTKQQFIQFIKSSPISEILVTSGKSNQKPMINKFTSGNQKYILIKISSEDVIR